MVSYCIIREVVLFHFIDATLFTELACSDITDMVLHFGISKAELVFK